VGGAVNKKGEWHFVFAFPLLVLENADPVAKVSFNVEGTLLFARDNAGVNVFAVGRR